MAAEERVGSATVKRAGKFAALVDEACDCGLEFLKWPVLTEGLKLNPKRGRARLPRPGPTP